MRFDIRDPVVNENLFCYFVIYFGSQGRCIDSDIRSQTHISPCLNQNELLSSRSLQYIKLQMRVVQNVCDLALTNHLAYCGISITTSTRNESLVN